MDESKVRGEANVTILLSTYNGYKFLQQQLDSLYEQTYPDVRILVRDDGSSDSTRKLLEVEQAKGRITLLDGHDNLGAALSFLELLKNAALTETEYVAFCDQDDVWHPEKITRAVSKLVCVSDNQPVMYCSRVELVDEGLAHLGYTDLPTKLGFGNALVDSVATGCSIVLNKKAMNLIGSNFPSKVIIHDWWCYLVISCFGRVVFDEVTSLRYRQHGNNTIGVAINPLTRLLRKYRRFWGDGGGATWMSEQASVLRELFKDNIPLQNRRILDDFIGAKASLLYRFRLAFSDDVWRQKKMDNVFLRLLILLNRF
jgi:glycosyltransferase involved in cell wall biosynthesis